MKTGAKVFLIIFLLIIAGGAVFGIDVYLSYKTFQDNPSLFDYTTPIYDIAPNNGSVLVSTTLNTTKLGYIPKSVRLDIIVEKAGLQYGDPLQTTVKIGESQLVEFNYTFEAADIITISGGGTIQFTIKITATPIYLGIPLKFLTQTLPDIIIDVP